MRPRPVDHKEGSILQAVSVETASSAELEVGSQETYGQEQQHEIALPLVQLALAGALTTFVGDVVMHPVDCIKTVQQSEVAFTLGLTDSIPRTAAYLWDTAGLAGFYKGFLTFGLADAAGGACKFAVWELWKRNVVNTFVARDESGEKREGSSTMKVALWASGAGISFLAASVFIVPGELIKQQLQMGYHAGIWQAVDSIWATEGIRGFFAGYDGVLFRDVPYTIIELGLYEVVKTFTTRISQTKTAIERGEVSSTSSWQEMGAAAFTGTVGASLTTPLDTIKTKLVVDADYAGANFFECFSSTLDLHGWSSLFYGVEARVAWLVPMICLYLPLYDALKRQLWKRHVEHMGL